MLNARPATNPQFSLPTSVIIFFLNPFVNLHSPTLRSMIYLALHIPLHLALQDFRVHFSEKALVPYHTWMCITHNGLQKKGEGLVYLQTQ